MASQDMHNDWFQCVKNLNLESDKCRGVARSQVVPLRRSWCLRSHPMAVAPPKQHNREVLKEVSLNDQYVSEMIDF